MNKQIVGTSHKSSKPISNQRHLNHQSFVIHVPTYSDMVSITLNLYTMQINITTTYFLLQIQMLPSIFMLLMLDNNVYI